MISKDELLRPRIGEGVVSIPEVGELTIRPLTRAQAIEVQQCDSIADGENLLVSYGLVDPRLTPAEVAAWAECAPAGELQAVSIAIGTISGMGPAAGKESYKSSRGKS